MSIALYFSHPIFIEWARYGFSSLPLSYPDRGKLIFVTGLVWQPPLWTSHAVGTREKGKTKRIPSNGEELDKITNQ